MRVFTHTFDYIALGILVAFFSRGVGFVQSSITLGRVQ